MSNEQALEKLAGEVADMHEAVTMLGRNFAALVKRVDSMSDDMVAMRDAQRTKPKWDAGVGESSSHIAGQVEALMKQVEDLIAKVEGRNKSAPTKRNMTDGDAMRVLNGDLKDMDHKQAAEAAGLTYAQVYSARGGFTFKHVLSTLEKGGWKNPWEKPKGTHKTK